MRRNRARHYRPLDPDEIMPFRRYRVGDILKRRMNPLPLSHYGVYIGLPDQPLVSQANKAHGVHVASVEEFAAGRRPKIVNPADGWIDAALRVTRARSRNGTSYNALTRNCEHHATHAQTGNAVSWQVRIIVGAMIVVLGVVSFVLAARR